MSSFLKFGISCLIFLVFGYPSFAGSWKAGRSAIVITPTQSTWMSGYGSRDRPSEGKRTELWCKAVVIEDSTGRQGVIITLDLVGIGRKLSTGICRKIAEKHSIQRNQIILNTSHTHTGPIVGGNLNTMYFIDEGNWERVAEYAAFLEGKVLETVEGAFSDMQPADLSSGFGFETFAVNRRNNRESSVPDLRKQGELNGPVDYRIPVLKVANPMGKPIAVIFGYACHATVLSDYLWSGDYPGYAQIELENRFDDCVALFMAGCGADVNPLPRRSAELARNYGKRLADAVQLTLEGVMEPLDPVLAVSYTEIPLKFHALPDVKQLQEQSESENRFIAARGKSLLSTLEHQGKLDDSYPYPIGVWQLGNSVLWITLGGEVVVDYSIKFRKLFGEMTWTSGYSHDVMAYIPSSRVWKEGGYEGETAMIYYGLPNKWSSVVEAVITDKVSQMVDSIRNSQD